MVWAVPATCLLIMAFVGYLAVRHGKGWIVWAIGGALIAAAAWALMRGQQETGWDGLGYAIFAYLFAAPALVGVLGGAAIGWLRRENADGP